MIFLLHACSKRFRYSRWWLGLFLLLTLMFSGCKAGGLGEEGLRANDLAEPARQVRSRAEPIEDKDSTAADDPWMSEKAQKISRNLQ